MPRIRTLWGWKCRAQGHSWFKSSHSMNPVDTRAKARELVKTWESYVPGLKYVAVPMSELENL